MPHVHTFRHTLLTNKLATKIQTLFFSNKICSSTQSLCVYVICHVGKINALLLLSFLPSEPSVKTVEESSGQLTFTVVRDGPVDNIVTVMYHTVDGIATEATRDYVDVMKTPLVFGVGEREKTVHVSTLEDDTPEPDETFYLELFGAEGRIMNSVQRTFLHILHYYLLCCVHNVVFAKYWFFFYTCFVILNATDVVSVLEKSFQTILYITNLDV